MTGLLSEAKNYDKKPICIARQFTVDLVRMEGKAISDISESVKEVIRQCIHSVTQLEVLLLLQRSPGREWPVQEVGHILYITEAAAANELAKLPAILCLLGKC